MGNNYTLNRPKISERTHTYGSKNAVWYLFNPESNNFQAKPGLSGKKAPLYNADVLHYNQDNPDTPVVIVEGEKDVETLANMEILATSLPNGGQSRQWHNDLYNAGLQGHDIIILTDNDKTGETYGKNVANNVYKIARSVKIVPARTIWSECPEKGDISDIVQALGEDDTIQRLAETIQKTVYYMPESEMKQTPDIFKETDVLIAKKSYEFEKKNICYVWYPYIPAGDYTVLMAADGTGKTYFACGVAATISQGKAMPVPNGCEKKAVIPENKNVLIISAEDRDSDIGERLEKSGADTNHIDIIDKTLSNGFLFPKDSSDTSRIGLFERTIEKYKPNLIIIDPWHAFCPPEVDVNRINHVRPIFQNISAICEKYDCSPEQEECNGNESSLCPCVYSGAERRTAGTGTGSLSD
ncbi:MAG: AAA family ATPase [Oscillospiraceae bacterium]|nr:AAA family ATPase [Oscillospiraceae bacterium]